MPVQDFLITFRADTTGALNEINALAARVAQVDAALNTAMGQLQRSRTQSPLQNLAAGSAGASRSINAINQGFLQMGRGVKLTKEELDGLKDRLTSLQRGFSRDTRGGFGPQINQGQIKEAIRLMTTLRDAGQLTADEYQRMSREINEAFGKMARIPEALRGQPVAVQERISTLMRRETMQSGQLDALREPVGGVRNLRSHQTALENYIRTVRELGRYGLSTADDLDRLEQELRQVRAASALQGQRTTNQRDINGFRRTADSIRLAQSQGANAGNPARELTQMRALERALIELEARNEPVQAELAQTRQRITELTAAAALASQRMRELNAAQNLTNTANQHRSRAQRPFMDAAGELRNLKGLERSLAALDARGDPVQAELDQTRRKIEQLEAAAARAKSVNQLLADRARLEGRLARTRLDGGNDRNLIRDLRQVELALDSKGAGNAGKLADINRQFAAMPPVINAATRQMLEFNRATMEKVRFNEAMQIKSSPGQLVGGLRNSINLMNAGYKEGAEGVDFFSQRVANLPPLLDRVAQGMVNHGRRVAEGLLIYELLGRAMQALGDQIKLVNDLAREEIRFSAVTGGLPEGGSDAFRAGIGDIAVRTNTPAPELAAQYDSVASAMLDYGDAATIAAKSEQFLNTVGQFTNITQRDLASETENLLGIFNQTGDSTEQFADRIGRIVVAGRNSSTIIAGITDVLTESGRSANAAGVDFDFLTAISSRMFQDLRGSMSGSEIGSLFNTMFGKFTDPQVVGKIEEISGGLIRMRDEMGNLRPAHESLIDIFDAIKTGALSIEQGELILDQIVPPLSPSTRSLIEETFGKNLPLALTDMGRIMAGSAEDANTLSEALVSGPGERFAASMKEIQQALTGIFSDEIIEAGNTFADILKTIAGILGAGEAGGGVGGAIASWTIRLGLFAGGLGIVMYAWKQFMSVVFGGSARLAAMAGMVGVSTTQLVASARLAAAGGAQVGVAAGQMTLFGGAAGGAAVGTRAFAGSMALLRGALAGVMGVAKALIPMLAIMAAFELPDDFANMANIKSENVRDLLGESRIDPDMLFRAQQVAGSPELVRGPSQAIANMGNEFFAGLGMESADYTDAQMENVTNLVLAMSKLQAQNKLTADSQRLLEDQILTTGGAVKDTVISADDLIAGMTAATLATDEAGTSTEFYKAQLGDLDETLDDVTDAEQRAADATILNLGLTDARAEAMAKLTQQLREGAITVDEWAEGQRNASAASESAANFIANYGNQLSLIPGLQERMAQTGETAAEALMGILMDNPDTIDARLGIIDNMIAIAEANSALAEELEENPPELSIETEKLIMDAENTKTIFNWLTTGTYEVKKVLDETKIEPQISLEKLRAQARAALEIMQVMLEAERAFNASHDSAFQSNNPEVGQAARTGARQSSAQYDALSRAIAELEAAGAGLGEAGDELGGLGDAFGELGNIRGDDPRLDSTIGEDREKEPSQTGIIDIGDLPPSAISQIIKIATAAQGRVVAAGGTVDDDETAAFFKDAAFQQLVSGVDQRFLQQAIEELTEVEKRRLELEQQRLQDVTRSIVTQVGPIQSLVSAPVLGAGGGVLTGQGLNADPRLGNFTINVPINWSGMNLQSLQKFIYESISKAWIDAGRGG